MHIFYYLLMTHAHSEGMFIPAAINIFVIFILREFPSKTLSSRGCIVKQKITRRRCSHAYK